MDVLERANELMREAMAQMAAAAEEAKQLAAASEAIPCDTGRRLGRRRPSLSSDNL